MAERVKVIVPWHDRAQMDRFLGAWCLTGFEDYLVLQQDEKGEGCALTKNHGITRALSTSHPASIIIILDDDCFPAGLTMEEHIAAHVRALEPQPVEMFQVITDPPSRGTPYFSRSITMPVAASMGYWKHIGDYDAPGQLVHGAQHPMTFLREPIHGSYFALSGMNIAFRASEWPWCQFVDVPRFDDIWQGFLWQRKAYAAGQCFNLGGPTVTHSRQSNVWANLRAETANLERNETIWQQIHSMPLTTRAEMLTALFPCHHSSPS